MTQSINQNVYFSRQSKYSSLCGLHVVNNFLGMQKYTQKQINQECEKLSPDCINPHKSIFGGNYDVNVLMHVFKIEGYDLPYHNHKNPIQISSQYCGFILNYEMDVCPLLKWFGFGRHWSLIKRQKNCYVQYDSLQQNPAPLTYEQLLNKLKGLNYSESTILKIVPFDATQISLKIKPISQ